MNSTGGTPGSLVDLRRPEWQWGDYYPDDEDEQRRAYVLDCVTRVTFTDDAHLYAALNDFDAWLKSGKFPEPEKPKSKPKLGTV